MSQHDPYRTAHLPIGTLVNAAAVIVGSLLGLGLQQLFPENLQAIIFQAIGLGTLLIGIKMSLRLPDGYLLVFIFSLILGGITGELLGIDDWLTSMGDRIKSRFAFEESKFTEGLVTAFLLFCVGSVTIIGAIEEGLRGKRDLLLVKSTLDGVSSVAFAATYGIGVLFSVIPLLIFQISLTLAARQLKTFFTHTILDMISATGGVLIIAVGIRLLGLGVINIENILPAIFYAVGLGWGYERFRVARSTP